MTNVRLFEEQHVAQLYVYVPGMLVNEKQRTTRTVFSRLNKPRVWCASGSILWLQNRIASSRLLPYDYTMSSCTLFTRGELNSCKVLVRIYVLAWHYEIILLCTS